MKTSVKTAAFAALAPLLGGDGASPEPVRFRSLHAHDPLRHSLSLVTGVWGTAVQAHQLVNLDSELDYGVYHADALTPGVQGGQEGRILDLGTAAGLSQTYGYTETVGGGQGFASVHFEGDRLVITSDPQAGTLQEFTAGNLFLAGSMSGADHAVAQVGHLYLVELTDDHDQELRRVARLKVVGKTEGERVDLTWRLLRPR